MPVQCVLILYRPDRLNVSEFKRYGSSFIRRTIVLTGCNYQTIQHGHLLARNVQVKRTGALNQEFQKKLGLQEFQSGRKK